jgi:hypothetical protein
MRRKTGLVVVGALSGLGAGCRATDATPRPAPDHQEATMPTDTAPTTPTALTPSAGTQTETSPVTPQQAGAPIAIAGDHVAWHKGGELELWSLAGKAKLATIAVPEQAVALGVAGDAIVAVAGDAAAKSARVLRIGPKAKAAEVVPGEYTFQFAGADRVIAAGAGGRELWVVEASPPAAVRYAVGAAAEKQAGVAFDRDQGKTAAASADGGLMFYESGSIVTVGAKDARTEFAVDSELASPWHLAAGPKPGTVWATGTKELRLVTLAGGKASITARAAVPGVAYHLAAADGHAYVLAVEASAGAWTKVTLAAFDAAGKPAWQVTVPTPATEVAWLAASPTHVAVLAGTDLRVYGASDGSPALP